MITIDASAPGKAVIAGEYAVLRGAPAISMAVDRRARVCVARRSEAIHTITAPGYVEGVFRFRSGALGALEWLDDLPPGDPFALVDCVWRQAEADPETGLALTLDTREFRDGESGLKLGLGSSAALAVALAAALIRSHALPVGVEALASAAHREFQHGAGSGVDIATSCHGGVIEYRVGHAAVGIDWPEGLHYRLLWSGRPASTASRLRTLHEQAPRPSLDRLIAASASVAITWREGAVAELLAELQSYTAALRDFGIDHGLGIFDAGHEQLFELARKHPRLVYKPCGAGGGDIGIALAGNPAVIDTFVDEACQVGFRPLGVSLDSAAVTVRG